MRVCKKADGGAKGLVEPIQTLDISRSGHGATADPANAGAASYKQKITCFENAARDAGNLNGEVGTIVSVDLQHAFGI
jgi:hypothetical protein